jgi:dTDP-4-dehydrorhamnose reductase
MRLLVTGASGQLGAYLLRELAGKEVQLIAWSGSTSGSLFGFPLRPTDLSDRDAVASAFQEARPAAVIHAAALATVAACGREPDRSWTVNVQTTAVLAELAAQAGARLVLVSTDLVFDGERGWYDEDDAPAPLSIYGRTKLAAEKAVLAAPRCLVARVSLLFGTSLIRRPAFFDEQLAALKERRPVTLFEDEWRTPLSLATAARALAALARSDCTGVLHLGGPERLSRLEMGRRLAGFLGADPSVLVPARRKDVPAAEPRPRDTSLRCDRWRALFPELPWPTWEEALAEMAPFEGG